jgi:TolB protein
MATQRHFYSAIAFALLALLLLALIAPAHAQSQQEQLIVFSSMRDGSNYELYTMHTDGTNIVRITNNASDDLWPDVSPDGDFILYSYNGGLWSIDTDGTGLHQIYGSLNPEYPTLSPDGLYVAFAGDSGAYRDLYTCLFNSCNPLRITNDTHPDRSPSWSEDGSEIAYASSHATYGVYTISSSGGTPYLVIDEPANESISDWCGENIVFHSNRDGDYDIYTIHADGTNMNQLTYNTQRDYYPKFSPDCSQIVFAGGLDGEENDIYIMNSDGSGLTRLTTNAANDTYPSISGIPVIVNPTATTGPPPTPIPTAVFEPDQALTAAGELVEQVSSAWSLDNDASTIMLSLAGFVCTIGLAMLIRSLGSSRGWWDWRDV